MTNEELYNKLFDEYKANLESDGIGARMYTFEVNGTAYKLRVRFVEQVNRWLWSAFTGEGKPLYSWPHEIKDFGDAIAEHFNSQGVKI